MADEVNGAVPKAALDCEISAGRSHGLDLNFTSSDHSRDSGDLLDSRREYKKLFFDCNLQLVLQKLLSRSSSPDATHPPTPSASSPFEIQGGTKREFTDAEVARLLRRHLHILVASQRVPDSEVVAAAKVLQRQYRPSVEPCTPDKETEKQGIPAVYDSESREAGGTSTFQDGCGGVGNFAFGTLEDAAQCSLGGFCIEASQVSDDLVSDTRRARFPASFEHPVSDAVKAGTGLMLCDEHETSQHAILEVACSGSGSAIVGCRASLSGTVDGLEQPAKKVCLHMRNAG